MSELLSHRINTLLLNANRSFPSQAQDARQMIKDWRHESRPKYRVVSTDSGAAGVSADSVPDRDDDGSPFERG